MEQYLLMTQHIQKKYNGKIILDDVTMNVGKGDIYGLIGRNGSGKTTLLRILTGQIQRYKGAVQFENGPQKIKIAALINSPALYLNLSAYENLKAHSYLLSNSDNEELHRVLKTVKLENCGSKTVENFSLGMKQRLKLGLALLDTPDILILDEPVNGLDPEGMTDLREILLKLKQSSGTTIIISSHILSELEKIITRMGILHNGKIVSEIKKTEILQSGLTLEQLYMRNIGGAQC